MNDASAPTRRLLTSALVAGPIYIVVGLAQVLTREGFDVTRHPLSLMSTGDLGWIQITNFLVTGALVVLGAIGLRRAVPADKRWKSGTLFIGLYGLGVIGGGVFVPDPMMGFPPGTPDVPPTTMSTSGMMHFIFGQVAFLSLIVASLIFSRYFAAAKMRGWAAFSAITGIFFLATIAASIAAMGAPWTVLALYAAVVLGWIWISALAAKTLRMLAVT